MILTKNNDTGKMETVAGSGILFSNDKDPVIRYGFDFVSADETEAKYRMDDGDRSIDLTRPFVAYIGGGLPLKWDDSEIYFSLSRFYPGPIVGSSNVSFTIEGHMGSGGPYPHFWLVIDYKGLDYPYAVGKNTLTFIMSEQFPIPGTTDSDREFYLDGGGPPQKFYLYVHYF
jgi:hypothetical protein